MRHQRHDQRSDQRSEREEGRGAWGGQGRYQARSQQDRSEGHRASHWGPQEEASPRWREQERDEDRDYQTQGSGQSYRYDDYDMAPRSGYYDDYGAREYQGLGAATQTGRDLNQGYSSSYGSRDLDYGSSESTGWGRGASAEESAHYGERGAPEPISQRVGPQRGSQSGYSQHQRQAAAQGRFAGRGPKGYKRSDERIKEDIYEVLTRDAHIDASDIEVEVKEGEVTLTGYVPERKMKHQAEDVVEACMGVKDVTNHLRVRQQERRGGSEARESSAYEAETERNERRGATSSSLSSSATGGASAGQMASSKKTSGTGTSATPSH